jgi:hypothetical protein
VRHIHVTSRSSWYIVCFLLLFSSLLALPLSVTAEDEPEGPARAADKGTADWHISGENTIRPEYYSVSGDAAASPYSYEDLQTYDEFNLNVNRRKSPFDTWRGQLLGVVNYSDYRSEDEGFIPERLYLFREKGDTALPHRFEVGDFFGFFSFRTLQRSLKGAQLELQPRFGHSGLNHSLLAVSGADQPSWRDFEPEENYANGFSYLIEGSELGRLSLNFVHNSRQGDGEAGTLRRTQQVYSLAGESSVPLFAQRLTIEGEVSHFSGDHDGISGSESGQDREDNGLYLQIRGRSRLPLTYRLRYEDYGQDYRPEGGVVTPDRRSVEGHTGWRFASGLQLRARIQNFSEDYETSNPTDTNVYGINFSGPMLTSVVKNMTGSLDTFIQDVGNRDKSTDYVVQTANLNLNRPLYAGWTGHLGLFYQDTDNQVAGSSDTTTKQATLSADHAIALLAARGTITPGVGVRKVEDPDNEGLDIFPTLALNLRRKSHSLGYSLAFTTQDNESASDIDVATYSQDLNYRYTRKRNTFGLEFRSEHRNPDPGEKTTSYMVGALWTYSFERPVREGAPRAELPAEIRVKEWAPAPVKEVTVDLPQLAPGTRMADIKERLKTAGITGAIALPNLLIYEKRLLEEVDQRQRLALVHEAGSLKTAALIIEFEDIGRPDDLIQTFEQVRRILLNRYGRPTNIFDRGEVSPTLLDDIRNGGFIRITEWSRPEGIIRFGIPRRLDGQIRMEVQFAEEFPPVTDTLWSLEEVR